MSEKRNIFGQVYDFFDELNQQQREMDVRDAARNRGPSGGKTEGGLPRISLPEWAAGLRNDDRVDIQRQGSANTLGELNGKTRTANPDVLGSYIPKQGENEDDLTFQSRVKGEQAGIIAVDEAIKEGVPKSQFYTDDGDLVTMETPKIEKLKEKYKQRARTISEIEAMTMGPSVLKEARGKKNGEKLSYEELLEVRSKAIETDPETIRERELHKDNLATNESNRETAKSNREVNEGTLILNTQKAEADRELAEGRLSLEKTAEANRNAISLSEIDYKNLVAANTFKNEQMRLQYENERAAADLDLRRDLAVLGLEGQAEDRRYNSERDRAQDKQMFILQLMKGLGSLGQGFSL